MSKQEFGAQPSRVEIKADQLKVSILDLVEVISPEYMRGMETGLSGRTIEKLAQDLPDNIDGFKTFKRVAGYIVNKGRQIRIESEPLDVSGTYWIDGEIFHLPEQEAVLAKYPKLIDAMADIENLLNDGEQIVITRNGDWNSFSERDSLISSKPQKKKS